MSNSDEVAIVVRRRDRREKLAIGNLDIFRGWCSTRNLPSMAASPQTVRLFLRELLPQAGEERMLEHLRAVRRVHLINGEPDPTQGAWDDGDEDHIHRPKRRLVKPDDSPSNLENTGDGSE